VRNPAWALPYLAGALMALGLLLQLAMGVVASPAPQETR
jgi:hypothetical protein